MSVPPVETQTDVPALTAGPPLGKRVAATFASPSRLAELIRERPVWLDVLLISTAVAVLAAAMMPAEILLDSTREAVSRRGTPVEITSSPEEIVLWGRRLGMLSAAVGHPLVAFALAGVLTVAFSIVPGGRNTFMEHVSLASHALLIPALGALAAMVLQSLSGGGEPHLSLAMLAPFLPESSAVRTFLGLISPFTIWMLFVVAIGVARLDPRRTAVVTSGVLVGGYLALAAALAG